MTCTVRNVAGPAATIRSAIASTASSLSLAPRRGHIVQITGHGQHNRPIRTLDHDQRIRARLTHRPDRNLHRSILPDNPIHGGCGCADPAPVAR